MKKEDISFLRQLVGSLGEAEAKLERAYNEKNIERFNKIKKIMLNTQEQIKRIVK